MAADVKDVGYVIVSFFAMILNSPLSYSYQNFDFPNNCEDYIHRIGRTGVRSAFLMWTFRRLPFVSTARWCKGCLLYLFHNRELEICT